MEDTYLAELRKHEKIPSSSAHTDALHQQEQPNCSLSESSSSHLPCQIPEPTQTQPDPQTTF